MRVRTLSGKYLANRYQHSDRIGRSKSRVPRRQNLKVGSVANLTAFSLNLMTFQFDTAMFFCQKGGLWLRQLTLKADKSGWSKMEGSVLKKGAEEWQKASCGKEQGDAGVSEELQLIAVDGLQVC